MTTPYVSIQNAKDVLENHPKFKQALRAWQIEKAIQGGASKDIAEAQISDYFLELVLLTAPRSVLYDFLDENKLYISLIFRDGYWQYEIYNENEEDFASGGYLNRHELEIAAFLKAIEIFEKWEEPT